MIEKIFAENILLPHSRGGCSRCHRPRHQPYRVFDIAAAALIMRYSDIRLIFSCCSRSVTSISSVESPDVPLRELEGFPLGPVDAVGCTATIGVERVEGWEPGWSCLVLGAHIYKVCCCWATPLPCSSDLSLIILAGTVWQLLSSSKLHRTHHTLLLSGRSWWALNWSMVAVQSQL